MHTVTATYIPDHHVFSITRKFTFDAAHRVYGHESKCKHLHGHTYTAEITIGLTSSELDELGRVIDFSEIKRVIGEWIDSNLDHNIILFEHDPFARWLLPDTIMGEENGRKVFLMSSNPTAENIAKMLYDTVNQLIYIKTTYGEKCAVQKVVVHETPNCRAEYAPGRKVEQLS